MIIWNDVFSFFSLPFNNVEKVNDEDNYIYKRSISVFILIRSIYVGEWILRKKNI